jgi:hypothetical protein
MPIQIIDGEEVEVRFLNACNFLDRCYDWSFIDPTGTDKGGAVSDARCLAFAELWRDSFIGVFFPTVIGSWEAFSTLEIGAVSSIKDPVILEDSGYYLGFRCAWEMGKANSVDSLGLMFSVLEAMTDAQAIAFRELLLARLQAWTSEV